MCSFIPCISLSSITISPFIITVSTSVPFTLYTMLDNKLFTGFVTILSKLVITFLYVSYTFLAQEYQSIGYIVTCNGDGWVLTIKKGSMR